MWSASDPRVSQQVEQSSSEHLNKVWLTVAEAVSYCAERLLPRTAKTIRKWAHRSHLDPNNGDIVVRREDVENGFRWVIERSSLDRKIEQELEFEARRNQSDTSLSSETAPDASEHVHTGANQADDELPSVSLAEPAHTGANPSAPVPASAPAQLGDNSSPTSDKPVCTSAEQVEPVGDQADVVRQLQARIEDLKSEIEFYRDELRDRRHATEALTGVIETFRLTAQSNAWKSFDRSDNRRSHDIRPTNEGDRWPGENAGDGVQ